MTTVSQAVAIVRGIIEQNVPNDPASNGPLPLCWQGGDPIALPDKRAPFIYTVFETSRSSTIENGGGRGSNRHRTTGSALIFIFVPIGWGLQCGMDYAEGFASQFRSYRDESVSVDAVTVYPGGPGSDIAVPGIDNEATGYFWSGCEIEFYFDLIG